MSETKNTINLKISFPSDTPGAVLDCKKDRATIPFNLKELAFLSNQFVLLMNSGLTGEQPQDENDAGVASTN